jgi:hypothetical protein
VQLVTILGLAVSLRMLYLRAKAAKTQPASSAKQRLKTAHVLLIALAVGLVVNFNLQHLNGALSGQPAEEPSPLGTNCEVPGGGKLMLRSFS